MQTESIGKGVPARATVAVIEGKNRDEIIREPVILPEVSFQADRVEDSRPNLGIGNAEAATGGSDQHPLAQRGFLQAEISGDEHCLLNFAPKPSKTLPQRSGSKAGSDRPAGRQLPVECAFDR